VPFLSPRGPPWPSSASPTIPSCPAPTPRKGSLPPSWRGASSASSSAHQTVSSSGTPPSTPSSSWRTRRSWLTFGAPSTSAPSPAPATTATWPSSTTGRNASPPGISSRNGRAIPPRHPTPPTSSSRTRYQHLLLTGATFFKGLEFAQLRRLALDIETACAEGFEFSNPAREEDRILSIAVMEEGGYEIPVGPRHVRAGDERLTAIIRERDPDVIEGHNLFRFDLEYIRARSARHGVRLRWGRDGSEPRVHPSRFTVAERIIDYPRWDIYGRSVMDTYFLLQIYDVSSRELESHGLKQAAIHFGLASPDRVYLDRQAMEEAPHRPGGPSGAKPGRRAGTLLLSRLSPTPGSSMARIFPYSYRTASSGGKATRSMPLQAGIPAVRVPLSPSLPCRRGLGGGYTASWMTGVFGPPASTAFVALPLPVSNALLTAPPERGTGVFLPRSAELGSFARRMERRRTGSGPNSETTSTPPGRPSRYFSTLLRYWEHPSTLFRRGGRPPR